MQLDFHHGLLAGANVSIWGSIWEPTAFFVECQRSQQPVVKVARRTEAGEVPEWLGAPTENIGNKNNGNI